MAWRGEAGLPCAVFRDAILGTPAASTPSRKKTPSLMDTQRLVLFFVFSFSLLMLWEAWQKENRPAAQAVSQTAASAVPNASPAPTPTTALPASPAPAARPDAVPGAVATPATPGARERLSKTPA